MAEKLWTITKKKKCEATNLLVEIIEIHKDITDGEKTLTSYLTEVACLNFRQCKHPCILSKNYDLTVKCTKPFLLRNECNIK